MARAIELSARGLGSTSPNPVVGCVILAADSLTVIGEGWHQRAGGAHAEVRALTAAAAAVAAVGAQALHGATAVVTLEPGSHTGRTRPCAQALLDAGITRVLYAVPDTGPVAGGGAAVLRAAGVEVEGGLHREHAERVNEARLTSARRPQGTLSDRQPLRVVIETHHRAPATAQVRDDAAPTWIATAAELGTGADGRVGLHAVLTELHRRSVVSVLLQGGPTLAEAFLVAGLVDQVTAYLAPTSLGDGQAALQGAGISTITDALHLAVDDVSLIGSGVRIDGRLQPRHRD